MPHTGKQGILQGPVTHVPEEAGLFLHFPFTNNQAERDLRE